MLGFTLLALSTILPAVSSDIGKLPNCLENVVPGFALVSTIDGKLSAINSEGNLQWQVETEPGSLLVSNIHNMELTNSGKWVRIIPSLSGSLYRFDGATIDPIPISAESLLKSSFKYSDDLVIAGGLDVRTYGVSFQTGEVLYVCSSVKCSNITGNGSGGENVLLLERSTQVVRAVEPHSGYERWNFSVGHHNIKLAQVTCTDPTVDLFNWNLTAVVPDGLLLASHYNDNVKTTWQYHFTSPIVRVWKWNGYKLSEVDLFTQIITKPTPLSEISPSIYLGMHKRQLYIYESQKFQYRTSSDLAVTETTSVAKIPWKPIPASELLTEDDSTAMSVLYSSEYVNGHGYYLYSEADIKQKNTAHCENNKTIKFPKISHHSEVTFISVVTWWWKEALLVLLTALGCNFCLKQFSRNQKKQVFYYVNPPSERTSESSDSTFNSRFLDDFDTLQCLGKGGFGVVFEVKQKIDECHYAIKRIVLPNEEKKRDGVMREVKALAKLEHRNIVRYFNSWVEKPPVGWQQQYDNEWISDPGEFSSEFRSKVSKNIPTYDTASDSYIVFAENSKDEVPTEKNIDDNSNSTDVCSYDESQQSHSGVNWRRPDRRYHNFNSDPPVFLYLQMQLCHKHSLREWLRENKERNVTEIVNMFKQILSAVEYVHLQGLIHRDLKPSNIFFSLDGQIKIGDFGLVKDVDECLDIPNSVNPLRGHTKEVGTQLYMSPEQLSGRKYNYKVDIYSLGLIFFELLVYFSTDMERISIIAEIRENRFPEDFQENFIDEYKLLTMMLDHEPGKRLTTFGIRARPPINCDSNYSKEYDYELPKSLKTSVKVEELV